MLLIGVDDPARSARVVDELNALHERSIVKVIDVIVVSKDSNGAIKASGRSGLSEEEAAEIQDFVGDALGVQVGDHKYGRDVEWDGWSVLLGAADVRLIGRQLYPGHAAVAAVFEHRWASRLSELLHGAGMHLVEDDVLTPQLMSGRGMGTNFW